MRDKVPLVVREVVDNRVSDGKRTFWRAAVEESLVI
jgi:hypothetical protein